MPSTSSSSPEPSPEKGEEAPRKLPQRFRVIVMAHLLERLLQTGYRASSHCSIQEGVPEDASIVHINYDPSTGCVEALFVHPSGEPLAVGEVAPIVQIIIGQSTAWIDDMD